MKKSLIRLGATFCLLFSFPAWADSADERTEIINLSNRYLSAVDAGDMETVMSTWADEAVLEWSFGQEHGKDEIRAALSNHGAAAYMEIPETATSLPRSRHQIISHIIDIDGDTATAIAFWFAIPINTPQTGAERYYFGHYEDELERRDGRWLYTKRSLSNIERVTAR